MKGQLKGLKSLKINLPDGAYRAIYDVSVQQNICLIIIVGLRENTFQEAQRRVISLKKQGVIE